MIPFEYDEIWTSIDFISCPASEYLITLYIPYTSTASVYDDFISLNHEELGRIGFTFRELDGKHNQKPIKDYDLFNECTLIQTPLMSIINKYFYCMIAIQPKSESKENAIINIPNLNASFNLTRRTTFEIYFNDLERLENEIKTIYWI